MYLRDLERKVMLEKGGKYDDMDEFEQPTVSYQEELDEIKTSLKLKVVKICFFTLELIYASLMFISKISSQDSDSEDDTDNGGLLSIKVKSKAEKDKDEEDFKTWLAGQVLIFVSAVFEKSINTQIIYRLITCLTNSRRPT